MSIRNKPPVSDQRIAFEAWYKNSHTSVNLIRTQKGYIDNTTRVAWRAWQAAQQPANSTTSMSPTSQNGAQPAAPEWQTIETAPKDGTAVLVMRDIWPGTESGRAGVCYGHNTYVAAWWAGENKGNGAWVCYMDSVCEPHCLVEPTHWMPLPKPPMLAAAPEQKGN